jgi:hypothetical protein
MNNLIQLLARNHQLDAIIDYLPAHKVNALRLTSKWARLNIKVHIGSHDFTYDNPNHRNDVVIRYIHVYGDVIPSTINALASFYSAKEIFVVCHFYIVEIDNQSMEQSISSAPKRSTTHIERI